MERSPDKPVRFEDAIAELEAIIERIESGECGLEECIAQYERGMKLVGSCQSILGVVQQRISELTADATGRLQAREAAGLVQPAETLGEEAALEGQLDDAADGPDRPAADPSSDIRPRRAPGRAAADRRPDAE